MIQQKEPLRKCVVTGERHPKKELIRVVRMKEGNVQVDETGKANGRGAYLKRDREIILKSKINKIMDKALEIEIPEKIYEQLLNIIE